ncbi:oligosaccharide flippase family protein [Streptococcus catagoni]|uniref:oligosaccharide flippase family protein n=1 Tax=Streptococcus catagoni TaxID=2654874 RepID=UPI00140AFF22|nr:oligosaccharide flippase family protein [Streptococcus catagoni]
MKLKIEKLQNQTSRSSLLIVLSGFISKILAAIYRIPYQNIVGDRGFYAYQQIYPMLAIVSALSLTAFPNVIASLSQNKDEKDLQTLFKFQLVCSLLASLILIVFHAPLAVMIGSPKLSPSIIVTGIVILTVPFISFYRGLAQAQSNMKPTAISQVIEQIVRIMIIIISALAYYTFHWTIYLTANVAACGNLVASLFVLLYLIRRNDYPLKGLLTSGRVSLKNSRLIGFSSVTFIFYTLYLLLFQLIDSLFIKNSLVLSGYSDLTSEISKGIFDRGQPLIQFGLIFTTAFYTTYLPILTKKYYDHDQGYQADSQHFFDFIFYFNLALTIGFMGILAAMNRVLFEDNKGWLALLIFLSLILLSSLIQFFHQKLFIEKQSKKSFIILCLGLILKGLLTPLLTYHFGIVGSSVSSVIPLVFVLFLYAIFSDIRFLVFKNVKYFCLLIIMFVIVCFSQTFFPGQTRLESLISLLVSTFIGLGVFIVISKKLLVFDQKLWSYLPFNGEK